MPSTKMNTLQVQMQYLFSTTAELWIARSGKRQKSWTEQEEERSFNYFISAQIGNIAQELGKISLRCQYLRFSFGPSWFTNCSALNQQKIILKDVQSQKHIYFNISLIQFALKLDHFGNFQYSFSIFVDRCRFTHPSVVVATD